MAAGCKLFDNVKIIRDMKSLKIWSLVALLFVAMTACNDNKGNDGGGSDEPVVGSFDAIEQEWKLLSVNGVEAEFNVYISFQSGMFSIFQQTYTLEYQHFAGSYNVDGKTLSGSYLEGGDWKCDYTGGVADDGKTMILKSVEDHPITYVYEACTIPGEVYDEATGTRAVEVIPFL